MKKKVAMLCALMLLVCTVSSTMAIAVEQPEDDPVNGADAPVDLTGMEVGDIIYVGDVAIKCVSDDEEGPTPPVTRTITSGFSTVFNGEQSDTQWLSLNSDFKYWYMWVKNTGSKTIVVTIGNDEEARTENQYDVGAGKTYDIWATSAWAAERLQVSFGNGSGMYGNATGVLCDTLNEALKHVH